MPKRRILIVEDEPIVMLHLKSCLEQFGNAVLPPVSSGNDALNSFKKYKPNLVLMDIVLEGEYDGIQARKKITQEFNVPVIFLTALLDSIEYPVIAIGCDEKITFLNSKIPPLLGKRDAQIFGKEFGKVFKLFSENGSRIEIPFDRILVKGEAEEFNGISLKISKEKTRLVDIVISPFKMLANKTIGSVLIIRDVSKYSMSREEKGETLEILIKLIKGQSKPD